MGLWTPCARYEVSRRWKYVGKLPNDVLRPSRPSVDKASGNPLKLSAHHLFSPKVDFGGSGTATLRKEKALPFQQMLPLGQPLGGIR